MSGNNICCDNDALKREIQRLQGAKRRALALADERAKEAVELRTRERAATGPACTQLRNYRPRAIRCAGVLLECGTVTIVVPANYMLFSELRQEVIHADPDMRRAWDAAADTEKQAREALRNAGASITRHTGGYDVPPDFGAPLEGKLNSAMLQRDEMLRLADEKIRDALRGGALTPFTKEGGRFAHTDWRGDFDSDYLYVEGERDFVCFERSNVASFVSTLVAEFPITKSPQRRGPPQKYDWEDGKLFVFKELNDNGDFDDPENQSPGWRSQNDLIDRLLKYMGRKDEDEAPGRSTAQGYVSGWVTEWRSAPNNSMR